MAVAHVPSAEGRLDFNNAIWVYGGGDGDDGGDEAGPRAPFDCKTSRFSPRGGKPARIGNCWNLIGPG